MEWACLAEAVLRSANAEQELSPESASYLEQKLTYDDKKLLDANGEAVMMDWEKPLMLAHANLICQNGGAVLNVGFGLGLVDDAIQGYASCCAVQAPSPQRLWPQRLCPQRLCPQRMCPQRLVLDDRRVGKVGYASAT